MEKLGNHGRRHGLDTLFVFRGNPFPGNHRPLHLSAQNLVEAGSQCHDGRNDLQRGEPGEEASRFFRHYFLSLRRLFQPLLAVGFNDALEVIGIVQVDIFQFVHLRVDIPRHGDVDEKHRPLFPAADRPGHVLRPDDVVGSTGGRQDDVRLVEVIEEIFETNRPAGQFIRQPFSALKSAVGDQNTAHSVADKVFRGQLAHLPCPDEQHGFVREVPENLLRQLHRGEGDRNRRGGYPRFGADTLGDEKGLVQKTVEDQA